MKYARRFGCFLLVAAALLLGEGVALAAPVQGSARGAYLIELKTGRVLYARNENDPMPMASTTKVMTALLALELCDLSSVVETGEGAYGRPGTSIYLEKGEKRTLEEMLYGLMIASGNDAAVAIAEHIGGSVDAFCEMMNERARELGATNTHFVNPNGLPAEGHVTTARDLTLIAAQAMKNETFREIVSTQRASIPWEGRSYMRILKNKNALLSSFEGATGIKTGFTRAAGRCLVFGAKRGEMEVVGTVLNCPDWFSEAADIMEGAFADYTWVEMLPDGERMGMIATPGGESESAAVVLQGALSGPVTELEMPLMKVEMAEFIEAPQPAGAQVGWATMMVDDEIIDKRPLVLRSPVKKKPTALMRFLQNWPLLAGFTAQNDK